MSLPTAARVGLALTIVVTVLLPGGRLPAQTTAPDTARAPTADSARGGTAQARGPWYERISFRGYTQVRYNGLLRTNPDLTCPQCDRALGGTAGISVRRIRLILSGDASDRLSFYIQPDFASDVSGALFFGQLRDAYFDLALDRTKAFRVRLGQSKIPFGWENLQSSSNRIPLDRADALNSALPNERDVAALFYWAPPRIRARLRALVDRGLKGSGDYGVVGVGAFNGEGANRADANGTLHTVARVSYPFELPGGQFVELGVQGYRGQYVLPGTLRSDELVEGTPNEFADERAAATFVLYPQPLGLQAEWNVGRGPEADPAARTVRTRRLGGGYLLVSYRLQRAGQQFTPFVRAHRYDGGKKFELDARRYRVRELETGVEWLPVTAVELTAMYTVSDRRYEDLGNPENRQRGRLLRVQAQFNY